MKEETNIDKKEEKGDMGAVLLLSSSMIGIGYLTLPYVCAKVGIALGLIVIVFCGLSSLFGSIMLVKAYNARKSDSYPDLVDKVLGRTHYQIISFAIIIDTMFSCACYIYFSQVLLSQVLSKSNVVVSDFVNFIIKTCIFIVSFALSMSSIQNLKFVSYVANCFALWTSIVIIVQTPSYYKSVLQESLKYFGFNLEIFPSVSICFFAYTNQFAIISLIKFVKDDRASNTLGVS